MPPGWLSLRMRLRGSTLARAPTPIGAMLLAGAREGGGGGGGG